MTKNLELRFSCALLAALLIPFSVFAEGEGKQPAVNGSLEKIEFGRHWGGERLDGIEELRGKVVLLKIWGGCSGCRAITPSMVELAKEHEGAPLHVIASYCQEGRKTAALRFLKSKGWDEKMENMTVMYRTNYSRDIKITYAPYYLIFDHTGKLRYHHQAGTAHGGNGEAYREEVAALLKEVPKDRPVAGAPKGALSGVRAWTHANGGTIKAALVSVDEDLAKFKMGNRTYSYPLGDLSKKSLDEIRKLADESKTKSPKKDSK